MKSFIRAVYVKSFFALVTLLFTTALGYGQTTYTWIGPNGGSWATAANWSPARTAAVDDILIFNNTGTISVIGVTSQTIRQIQFLGNSDVTLQASAAGQILSINGPTLTDNLVVANSATLRLASTATFTIRPLITANQRWDISGKVVIATGNTFNTSNVTGNLAIVSATGSIDNNGGTFTTSTTTLLFDAGSNYNHLATTTSMVIPTATWDATSNVNINSITTATALTGFTQTFGNVTFNSPSQSSALVLASTATINGNLNVVSTGTGSVVVSTAANTLTVNGDFNLSGGTFNLNSSTTITTFNLAGNYNQTGGTLTKSGATSVATINFRGVNKTYIQSGGTVTNTLLNYNLNLAGASLTLNSNINVAASRTFAASNGTLYCGTNVISGAGTFTLSTANATLGIGSPAGITSAVATLTGNIQTTTARNFAVASNYIYTGTDGQITGSGLPAALTGYVMVNMQAPTDQLTFSTTALSGSGVNVRMVSGALAVPISYTNTTNSVLTYEGNAAQTITANEFPIASGPRTLVINNAFGVNMGSARSVYALNLTNGLLNNGSNLLTILGTTAASVLGGSAISYVNGALARTFTTGTLSNVNFPIGKTAYQLLTINPTISGAITLTAEAFDGPTGGTNGAGLISLNTDHYWSLAKTGTGSLTAVNALYLTDAYVVPGNHVAYATTQTGTYNIATSTISGNTVSPINNIAAHTVGANASSTVYYAIGSGSTLSGIVPVGNSSSITKLHQIAQILNNATLTGDVIFELQADYDGTTGEVFPITFYPFASTGGTWKATVRPAAGVSMRTTSGGTASTNFIVWDGVDNLTFDGRPGGVGSALSDSRWTLRNTTTSGTSAFPVLKLIDDATYNTIQYCYVEGGAGATNGANSGIINMVGGTTTTGNDFNTIAYNRIAPIATSYLNGIYSNGNSGVTSNSDNTILGNELFNFSNGGIEINGTGNGSNWVISNNSLYNTGSSTSNLTGIQFNSNASTNNTIANNYVGGKSALGGTSGQPWLHTNGSFTAIVAYTSNGTATTITNNKVQNITSSAVAAFWGIDAAQGTISIGTSPTTGNTVGHPTDATLGITSASINSIIGIRNTGSPTCNILYNTVANISSTGASSSTGLFGIYSAYAATSLNVVGNKIYNLQASGTSLITGIGNGATGATSQNITNNLVHSLFSTYNSSTAVTVTGINFTGSSTLANNNIKANFVNSLSLGSTNTSSTIKGINIAGGVLTVANNMVRLGIDRNGSSITGTYTIVGIDHASTTANNAYYYNSVQIAGTGVAATATKTYAFRRTAGTTALNIRNNIFINDRSNTSSGGAHIAMGLSVITGVTSNTNLFNAVGTNGTLFELGTTAYNTLPSWNTATSNQDLGSFVGPAGFINTTGDATSVDLHINPNTPTQVEGNATAIASVTDDYDGDARVSPDLGADEGSFTPIDLTPPVITNPTFANACSDVLYPVSVTITDMVAVSATLGTAPRIYYKKSTDANVYNGNTSATAGWKYVEATNTTSPFTFNIDFSLLNGGVQPNQSIQYFVVAQDVSYNTAVTPVSLSGTVSGVALTSSNFPTTGTAPGSFTLWPCSGTVTVGTGGNYGVFTTSTGIFNTLNQIPALNGNLVIKVVSDITTEDGNTGLNQLAETGAGGYTITIEADANTLRSISGTSGASNLGLFRINGADRVIFNGGIGANKFLKFSNTGTGASAATFNFINDSKYITVNNCVVEGGAVSGTYGVITIGTSATTGSGNDTITIANCDIKSYGTNFPTFGVFATGTSTRDNSGVVIDNCNIYDNYATSTVAPAAIWVQGANNNWNITNNKIYQTAARSSTATLLYAGIRLSSTGGGFNISGNYIGGADAAGNGITSYGTGTQQFAGIWVSSAASPISTISNNTIKGIAITSTSGLGTAQGVFSGIYIAATSGVSILNNTIGSETVNGNISATVNNNTGGTVYGIRSESINNTQINGNTIAGITATGTGSNNGMSIHGIHVNGGVTSISNNKIGGTTANNIQIIGTATTNASSFSGINLTASSSYYPTVVGNTIQNITNGNTTTSGTGVGIYTSGGGSFTITNNTIANLSNIAGVSGIGTSASLSGIIQFSANGIPHAITANKIYNLSNNSTSAATVTGIYYSGSTGISNINKNFVYNLKTSNVATSNIIGLHVNTACIASNNMIRLGYDATGATVDLPIIHGIYKDGSVITRSYFNSVYVGGTASGTANSYAYRKTTATQDTLRNNIFINERTGGTGKNYAITTTNATAAAVNSNYNLLFTPNANGVLFGAGTLGVPTVDYTMTSWGTATTGQDANSLVGSPNFVSPTTTVPNLHIQSPTPAESAGIAISYIIDDFDGDDRSLSTPSDIGADAGLYAPMDILPPSISYTAFGNTCNDVTYNVSATITDNIAISTTSNTAPRIYYKRTYDANTFNNNTATTQGWKYVTATNTTSPFSFSFDYSILFGGGHANDTIQYFIIAQDASANTTINSGTVGLTAPANSVALTASNFPTTGTINQFVLWPCSGVVTVGTGGNYGVFTTANGVFKAINDAPGLNGNLTLKVISDITIEDGLHGLNQWIENGIGGYTVTIEPDANILRSVSGTSGSNLGLFRLNGADRVRFNGGTGTNQYLKISNTLAGATASTINLINDATDITINNCVLEGGANSTAHGVVTIGAAAASGNGNDNISINSCDIKAYNANYPTYGIYAFNNVSATNNNNVTINNCNIYDNYSTSVAPSAILIGTGNSGWTVSNNRIYQTMARSTAAALLYTGIRVNNTTTGGFTITDNQIGSSDAFGNNMMTYSSTGAMQYSAIYFSSIATLQSSILGNTVKNIAVATSYATTGTNSNAFSGIYIVSPSAVNIANNTIGSTTDTASITVTINANAGVVNGIKTESATAVSINKNAIAGMKATATSANGVSLIGINATLGSDTITNNAIGSAQVENSMMVTGAATTNASLVAGIVTAYSAAYSPIVKDNTVSRISNLIATGTTGNQQAAGIIASGTSGVGIYNIIGNTVSEIAGGSTISSAGSASSILGISAIGGATAHNIIGNTVYNLRNTSTSGTPSVTGINYLGGAGIANLSKNLIYNIQSNTVANSVVTGMQLSSACMATNNMVRLGYDVAGSPLTDASVINGILKDGAVTTRIFFNSIYIGGTTGVGAANSYAFRKTTINLDSVRNNIFVNARSGGAGKHYAAAYYNTASTSILSNYNVVNAPATNGVLFGVINPSPVDYTQQAWSSISGQDNNSLIGAPNFVSPTSAIPNLHVQNPTISEGSGINISYISDDFDGDNRSLNTPTDIGADAAINTFADIYAPSISYIPISIQDVCNAQPINIQVTVTDIHSGISLTSNKPRMYLRKSAGSYTNTWGTYPSIEGTFVSGNSNLSIWNFVLDYTTLGITVAQGDQFEYYFVAQDVSPIINIGYSQQSNGTPLHSNVATIVTASNFALNSSGVFAFANPLSGIVTVGSGGTYNTFNGPNGLFNAINTQGLSGNITVNVISDIDESALFTVLGPIQEFCGTGYKVLVQSDAAVVRNIYQNTGGRPMINLAGCKNIEFNGTNNGTGKYLLLSQRQNYPTIHLNGHTTNATDLITFESCVIEGNNRTVDTGYGLGVVSMGGIKGTGQVIKNISLTNNKISNLSHLPQDAQSAPGTLIYVGNYLGSSSAVVNNSSIKIKNNELFNFYESAVQIRQNVNGYGIGDSISIDSNNIYEPLDFASYQYPIWLEGGTNSKGHSISSNTIGGNLAPTTNINGTWTNTKADGEIVAIYTLVGGNTAGSGVNISNNTVANMTLLGTGYTNFIGIRNEQGAANIYGNMIGSSTILNCITNMGCGGYVNQNSGTVGIWNQATVICTIEKNTISGLYSGFTVGYDPFQYINGITHGSNLWHNGKNYTNTPGGSVRIIDNTISNLNSASILYDINEPDALYGIFSFSANGSINNEISRNLIHTFNCTSSWTNPANNTKVFGIGIGLGGYGSTQTGILSSNIIYNLNNNSRSSYSEVNGLLIGGGNWSVTNNMITLSNSSYPSAGPLLTGIYDWTRNGRTTNIHHNTVYITGSISSGNNTYAYCRQPDGTGTVNGASISIRNNIFFNDRSSSANNVSIANIAVSPTIGWSSNYNFLVSRNASVLGRWTNSYGNLTGWQTVAGDANSLTAAVTTGNSSSTSVNAAELFVSLATGNLHINTAFSPYPKDFVSNKGTGLATVTADIDNDPRNVSTPDLGCDEFSDCSAPIITLSANGATGNTAVCAGNTAINLITTPTSTGNGCSGIFEYAISNGALYWDGSTFASPTPIYNSSYNNINFPAITSGSYTATIACNSDQSCRNISSTITVSLLDTIATVNAAIGTPANGTSHNMSLSWAAVNGATGYDIDYSNNGSSWTTIATNVSGTAYNHNTGDSPNLPTYYRVKPRTGTITCSYTTMVTPVYTACDTPSLPQISNVTSSTLDITLQAESPVANPSYTTYSIYSPSTNQYVQADGTLGAVEVFQTSAQWGTITVTGLTTNTNYCFYATAQNMDGDKRNSSQGLLAVQQFNTNIINNNLSSPTNQWWTPNSCTSGIEFSYSNTGGCTGGTAEYSGTATGSGNGCFLRSPAINCVGYNEIVLECDISNSFRPANVTDDGVLFNMWQGSSYIPVTYINNIPTSVLKFDSARNCERIKLKYDISNLNNTQKASVLFYANTYHTAWNSNGYYFKIDNISITSSPSTSCATTLNCATPVITTQPVVPSPICAGAGLINISVSTTGTGLTYQWRRNGANIVTGGIYAVNSSANTSTLTITNPLLTDTGSYDVVVSNACSQTVTSNAVTLTIHQTISGLTVGSNSPVCEWSDVNFTSAVLTGNGLTYNWTGPNGFNSNIATPTKPMLQEYADEGSYTLTVSNTCNSLNASTLVYVHPAVEDLVAFASTPQICEGDTLILGAAHINAIAVSDVQWQWTGPNGFAATTKQTLNPNPTISGVYTVNAINACGTFTANTPYITVDTIIEADAGPDAITNVCGALTIQLQAVGNGVWAEINGTSSSFSPNGATNNATVTTNGYGLKQYRWTVTNGACTSEDDARYFFNPAITTTVSLEGCNFTNGDTILVSVTANGGSSTLGVTPPMGSELIIPNVTNNTSIYTMPMDGTVRSYTISDGICSTTGSITPPPTHPTDIPYKNSQGFANADCYGNGFNKWLTFRDTNNDAILSVNDNGNNLGKITASVYRDAVEPIISQSSFGDCQNAAQVAMKRHFILQSDVQQPFVSDVSLRLYFSENELNDLVAASQANDVPGDDCSSYDNLTGLTDLYVTKYSGANEDGDYMNNTPDGIYRVYAAGSTMQASPNGFATLFSNGLNHHYVELNVREFSELWLHGSTTGSALPVEMLYLKADAIENKYIQLTWATALEIDNNGFVIERSSDAQNWSTIGWIDGNNNSTVQQSYAYDDYNVTEGIVYYYRLKQIDNDGAYEYTGIVSAKLNITNQVLTVADFIPNPAINTTQLVVISPAQQEISLEVFDVVGRKVVSGNHSLNKGSNTIPFAVNAWAAGTYTAVVTFGNETYSKKLVVIK